MNSLLDILVAQFNNNVNVTELLLRIDKARKGWITRAELEFVLRGLPCALN
jgi:hypothetical protein